MELVQTTTGNLEENSTFLPLRVCRRVQGVNPFNVARRCLGCPTAPPRHLREWNGQSRCRESLGMPPALRFGTTCGEHVQKLCGFDGMWGAFTAAVKEIPVGISCKFRRNIRELWGNDFCHVLKKNV